MIRPFCLWRTTQARRHSGQQKLAAFQDQGWSHEGQLPLIGIYSCLLCERRFSTKLRLNRHYRETHGENIQDYKGKSGVLVIWHLSHLVRKPRDFQDTYKSKDQTD